MDEYRRFQAAVMQNTGMQEDIKAIGGDTERIIKYANEKGYLFTMSDVRDALKEGAQLTEDQLEDVAGGSLNVLVGAVIDVSKQASAILDVLVSAIFIL